MMYRMELRRLGEVIKVHETDRRKEAREIAKLWMETTQEAVLILFVDGKEIRLKNTAKELGMKGKEFDSLKRYSAQPVGSYRIIRHTGTASGGRVSRKLIEYSEDNR